MKHFHKKISVQFDKKNHRKPDGYSKLEVKFFTNSAHV